MTKLMFKIIDFRYARLTKGVGRLGWSQNGTFWKKFSDYFGPYIFA